MSRTKSVRPGMKTIVKLLVIMSMFVESALAEAQQPKKVPRIGYLNPGSSPSRPDPRIKAFQLGLRELGYVEGKDIVIERRYAEAGLDILSATARDLVHFKVLTLP